MATEQQPGRTAPDGEEPDFTPRPVPFLVGLWRQLGPDAASGRAAAGEPELFAALQSEIIPRLMIANQLPESHLQLVKAKREDLRTSFSVQEREAFLLALLAEDGTLAADLAAQHLNGGREKETILIELFAWAARELGELWADDRASFVDVTIGLCRLHEALHHYSEVPDAPPEPTLSENPSILIASAPGEQHVFGVLMAGELFRQHGWIVTTETSGDAALILKLLATRRFDMAGLSVSHDLATAGLADLVGSMRKASRNPALKMLVGGHLFERAPQVALEIGADGIAGRGPDAPELARKMLAMS